MNGKELTDRILQNVGKVVIGKERVAKLLLVALVSDGHVLLEDVPGTGKTKLAKTLAKSLDAQFARIQFTPDLLPSDVTGLNIYDQKEGEFVLRKGPVFTNILLADEINRATPRTQAGLLECMEERQVTIDGVTHPLERPFFVIATQNPVESSGTFPLPEAQMDRFMMRLSMGLPDKEEELQILDRYMEKEPLDELLRVSDSQTVLEARKEASHVFVHECVREYMVDIVEATRRKDNVAMGVSPRGTLALMRCSKAYAYLSGRGFVTPDDVKAVAVAVLAHRIVMSYGFGRLNESQAMIEQILNQVTVPTEDFEK